MSTILECKKIDLLFPATLLHAAKGPELEATEEKFYRSSGYKREELDNTHETYCKNMAQRGWSAHQEAEVS